MKAYHFLAFLLLVNLSVSIVNILHIYNTGVDAGEAYSLEGYESGPRQFTNWFMGTALTSLILFSVYDFTSIGRIVTPMIAMNRNRRLPKLYPAE